MKRQSVRLWKRTGDKTKAVDMTKIPLLILLVVVTATSAHPTRLPRFLGLSYLFGGGAEEPKTPFPTPPDLSSHPVWKVHKYNGITIHPVSMVSEAGQSYPPPTKETPPQETYGPPQETYGPPQETYNPPQETYTPPQETYTPYQETYGPPQETYGPSPDTYSLPPSSGSSSDVSSSLDALGSLAAFLPDEMSSGGTTKGSNTPRHGYIRTVLDRILNAKSNIGSAISGLAEGKRTALDVLSPSQGGAPSPDTASLLLGLLSQYPQLAELFSRAQEDEGFQLPSLPDLPDIPAILGLEKIPKLPKLPLIKIPKHSVPYAPAKPAPASYAPSVPDSAYGAPREEPAPYSPPVTGPYPPALPQSSYGPPPSELPTTYDTPPYEEQTPYSAPESTYGVPEEPLYPAPYSPPQPEPTYGPPVTTYGVPEPVPEPQPTYGAPEEPQRPYNPAPYSPPSPPEPTYGVPEPTPYAPPEPQPTYGVPEEPQRPYPSPAPFNPPEPTYGVPKELQPPSPYNPPSEPTYAPPAEPQSTYRVQSQRPTAYSPPQPDYAPPPNSLTPPASSVVPQTTQENTIGGFSPPAEVTYKAVSELPVSYHVPAKEVPWTVPKKTYAASRPVVYETIPGKVTTVIYPEEHYGPEYIPPILDTISQQWARSSDANQEVSTGEGFFPLDPGYLSPFVQYKDEPSEANRFRGRVHVAQGEVIIDTPNKAER